MVKSLKAGAASGVLEEQGCGRFNCLHRHWSRWILLPRRVLRRGDFVRLCHHDVGWSGDREFGEGSGTGVRAPVRERVGSCRDSHG